MSQSTLTVNDGSGSSVLTQLNAALQALATSSSGTAAPTTTYPYQFWADTTNNLWKMRNAGNTAWVTLGALGASDGLVGAVDGAKLTDNTVALSKLVRGTLNKVLLAQGVGSAPVWGDPVFDASALVAGSVTADKLAAGVVRGKVASLIIDNNETLYFNNLISDVGELLSVGYNSYGQFGNASTAQTDAWVAARYNVPFTTGATISKAIRNMASMYVLTSDGKVYAAGYNGYGQLGVGDTTNRREFVRLEYFVTAGLTPVNIFCSVDRYNYYDRLYVLCSNGALYACGYNGNGELGVGDTSNRSTPTLISGSISNITKVVAAAYYTFLLTTTGTLYATGYNNWGTLGLGDTTTRSAFTLVSSMTGVADIQVYDGRDNTTNWSAATCAIVRTTSGDLYATGYNGYGQLGLGDTTNRSSFTKISSLANIAGFTSFGGGCYGPIVAWSTTGVVYTWGYNGAGAIGDGSTTNRSTPWQVLGWAENVSAAPPFQGKIQQVLGIGSALGHCAGVILDTDGNLWGVGRDSEGQCGTGTQTNNLRFTRVRMPTMGTGEKITSIARFGYDQNTGFAALTNKGRCFATGYNNYGQAGNISVRSTTVLYTLQPINFV